MKERWAPSSNRMWPSTVVCPADTFAIAVFNKHTLVENVEKDVVGLAVPSSWVVPVAAVVAVFCVTIRFETGAGGVCVGGSIVVVNA